MCWRNWYIKISTRKHNLNCNTKIPDLPTLPTLCNYGMRIPYSFETSHNIRLSLWKVMKGFLPLTKNHSYSKRGRTICMAFTNTCNGSFSQCPTFHYFCQKGRRSVNFLFPDTLNFQCHIFPNILGRGHVKL